MTKRPVYYVLDGHTPVPADLMAWAYCWSDHAACQVGLDELPGCSVSTVFLGIDRSWFGLGRPVLFETMVFGGPRNGDQWRYSTWDQAAHGHAKALALVKADYGEWLKLQGQGSSPDGPSAPGSLTIGTPAAREPIVR